MSLTAVIGRPTTTNERPTFPLLWAWAAVFVNVLAFSALPTLVPIPGVIGQLVTQGALPAALLLAILANRHGVIRPNVFLVALTLLAVVSLMVSLHSEFFRGSTFRASRFVLFVGVLWLLTPWWGRRDMTLLRCHRLCLGAVLISICAGALLAPGKAFSFDGRLTGTIWPVPATQVAHYAAIMLGTTVLLWMCHVVRGWAAALWVVVPVAVMVGTHTRTAIVGLVAGLVCAMATLFLSQARARRTILVGGLTTVAVSLFFASEIRSWALRGQTTEEASQLTGRTKVWTEVLEEPRAPIHEFFGSGMSNLSWEGLPIDSTWVGTYLDQGVFGVAVLALLMVFLVASAITTVSGTQRALATFLIVYCLFASITETGLGGPSPYLLDLTVAASLLTSRTEVLP